MLPSLVTALITASVALVGAWWVRKTAQEAQHSSPYEALAARVVALEEADSEKAERLDRQGRVITQLRDEVSTLADHTLVVQAWIDAGMPPPPPIVPDTVAELVRRLRADGNTSIKTWRAPE